MADRPRCPGHARHWFAVWQAVGLRSPVCVRCGAPNSKPLTEAEWDELKHYKPGNHHIVAALSRHYGAAF